MISLLQTGFNIGSVQIPNRLMMAPMCGITHKPFRKIIKKFGAGMVATQMASAKALTLGDQKSRRLLEFDESERPIVCQIFGNSAETISEAARMVQDMGPDIIDLNMGCPAKKIVDDGGGSALLRCPDLAKNIFEKTRKILKIPFTVKMRSGWDKEFDQAYEVARIAQDSGLDAITLHARTRAQGYSGKANWELIALFKSKLSIPVIGNGDVETPEDVERMFKETGCDAVMMGRSAVSEPWIFKSCLQKTSYVPPRLELKNIILEQYDDFFSYYGQDSGIKQMRKHLCAYTRGFEGGSRFRNSVVPLAEWGPLKAAIEVFFGEN